MRQRTRRRYADSVGEVTGVDIFSVRAFGESIEIGEVTEVDIIRYPIVTVIIIIIIIIFTAVVVGSRHGVDLGVTAVVVGGRHGVDDFGVGDVVV